MKGLEETWGDKKEERRWTAAQLTMTGLMAAVLCILGPVSLPLPFSPVPISLGTLAVYLAAVILGGRLGTVSCALYLLLGLAGLPVFSGYAGGAAKLFGPTGGYLTGYLFLAMTAGAFAGKEGKVWKSGWYSLAGMLLGTLILYVFGTLWLAWSAGMSFYQALWAGVLPFIPGDLLKMGAALLLGGSVRTALVQAGMLPSVREKSH